MVFLSLVPRCAHLLPRLSLSSWTRELLSPLNVRGFEPGVPSPGNIPGFFRQYLKTALASATPD